MMSRRSTNRRSNFRYRKPFLKWQIGIVLAFCVILMTYKYVIPNLNEQENDFATEGRLLEECTGVCETKWCDGHCLENWEVDGGVALYIVGILYVFVALAIVCDEFFVASLEKISDSLHLSEDVAGATFMAGGSSAPELFVSLADNVLASHPKSVGVGTIVGSAIFNILIIIAITAMLAGQALQLDWRPLIRDATWYAIAILVLTVAVNDEKVTPYEAAFLLLLYAGYILTMKYNNSLMRWMDKFNKKPELPITEKDQMKINAAVRRLSNKPVSEDEAASTPRTASVNSEAESVEIVMGEPVSSEHGEDDEDDDIDQIVIKMDPADETTDNETETDGTKDNSNDDKSTPTSPTESAPFVENIPGSSSGVTSESSVSSHMNPTRKSMNRAFSMTRRKSRLSLKPKVAKKMTFKEAGARIIMMNRAMKAFKMGSNTDLSAAAATIKEEDEEDLGGYWDCCKPPSYEKDEKPNCFVITKDWTYYLISLPLVVAMKLTIPDCRFERFSGWKGFTSCFIMSIAWIGLCSHILVEFASKFGCIVGISSPLMGLTLLAAGTSVPDALSSVIVARQGEGNMAVSNAIGSNVFDILMCLGFPYFISTVFVHKKDAEVATDDLLVSILILFGILLAVVGLLIMNKWQLKKNIAYIMFAIYGVFVIYSLATASAGDEGC
eukprot:TRINITY_DN1954_c0_g1_i1.p1 TRINITY_DN1954_c0_g1~~TRINITY_DN1954_c0_g1_i1.p1  ORF type:complete len:687 (-),score=205.01 TRINITY_DN1954_c0_g1_i1:368-2371(-)